METSLMVTDYPEPPESKEKAYIFVCDCSVKVEYCVYARDEEEARELLLLGQYDDLNVIDDYQIEDIEEVKIDG